MPMTIRCYECGKVYDVVFTSEERHEFPCPACGKVEALNLGAIKAKAIAANKRLMGGFGGRR